MDDGTLLAALDLGSNSFRLEIGRLDHGRVLRTEYLKETVRQGGGLTADGSLTLEALQRGWDCLARFGERLAGFEARQVRAVATQTLREARNREEFLARGAEVLGFPIDVISGPEEARLIYAGAARLLPPSSERRLVVDVGGRSTELVLGQSLEARVLASCPIGSVASSLSHFPDGRYTVSAFAAAQAAAEAVLEDEAARFPRSGWDVAYGASGTVGAIGDILTALGEPPGLITRAGLHALRDRLLQAQHVDRLRLVGLKEDRRPVIAGGISVLCAVFAQLGIERLQIAQGALRQGVLYDLLQREAPATDIRTATVQALARRFGVDAEQAERVDRTARSLFTQLCPGAPEDAVRTLHWAAQLHEIGNSIAHGEHPRHGAYILEHADAPGFGEHEQRRLARLVLGQRGKLRKLPLVLDDAGFAMQLACLRLAVLLCHARRDPATPLPRLERDAEAFCVTLPARWVDDYPQSSHLLREEMEAWRKTPWAMGLAYGS